MHKKKGVCRQKSKTINDYNQEDVRWTAQESTFGLSVRKKRTILSLMSNFDKAT